MRSYIQRIMNASFMSILLVGCATPQHTNTLIFGTNTKFALDASADPVGSPSLTLGYKREEAVWMPLVANKANDGSPCEVSERNANCKLLGKDGTVEDTYSVLASFGAKFNGEARTGGGLAQFFATGIAARKLAESGGASLVSVQEANIADARARSIINRTLVTPENIRIEKSKIATKYISSSDSDKAKFHVAAKAAGFESYEDFALSANSEQDLIKFNDNLK